MGEPVALLSFSEEGRSTVPPPLLSSVFIYSLFQSASLSPLLLPSFFKPLCFSFVILCRHFLLLSLYLPGLNNKTDVLWVDAFI